MKIYKVSFLTYHESYNGHDHNDGYKDYIVSARNSDSARKKAEKAWHKEHTTRHWIQNTSIIEEE